MKASKRMSNLYDMSSDGEWTPCLDAFPAAHDADGQEVIPARPLITKQLLAYLSALFVGACHYGVGDVRLQNWDVHVFDEHLGPSL